MDIISQADLDYEGEKREGNISRTSNIWVRSYLLHLYLIIRKTKKPPKQEKGCVCVCVCTLIQLYLSFQLVQLNLYRETISILSESENEHWIFKW